jgi:hypothetical protein
MEHYESPIKEEMIAFIQQHLGPIEPSELTTLAQIKDKMRRIDDAKWAEVAYIMAERGIYDDDLPDALEDNETFITAEQASAYMDSLYGNRVQNEQHNLDFSRKVDLATRPKDKEDEPNLFTLPKELRHKVKSYGVLQPDNAKREFDVINKWGGKKRKMRRSNKKRRNKKRNKRTKRRKD